MLIYNVTCNVEKDAHEKWMAWIKQTYLRSVMATGCFSGYRLLKLLGDDEGVTYAFQFNCPHIDKFLHFQAQHKPALMHDLAERFNQQAFYFETLLEEVEQSQAELVSSLSPN
ncbi:MAG: DUF4286 family protein [Bernardetiaceae bacterium]|jgi:hypothetical protein|nr:DUF4286 family protein [Bernardetiaceae bacterium]